MADGGFDDGEFDDEGYNRSDLRYRPVLQSSGLTFGADQGCWKA